METHLAVYYQALAEVDELRRRLFEAENDLAHSRVELEAAKAQLAEADSRVNRAHLEADLRVREYQAERDQAVTQRAEYEILLMNIWSLLRRSVSNVSGQRLASLPEIDERQEESAPAAEDGSA